MFQDKNTTEKKTQTDLSSSMGPDAPIHLMKNDLEEIKNPKKEIPINSTKPNLPTNLSEKQKSSPFFSPVKPQENRPVEPKKIPEPVAPVPPKEPVQEMKKTLSVSTSPFFSKERSQETKKETPKEIETSVFSQPKEFKKMDAKKSSESSALNKIILAFAVFLLLLAIGASGYYFWTTRDKNQNQPEEIQAADNQPKNEPVAIPKTEPKKETVIELSTEKTNYLPVDIANANKDFLKGQLDVYLKRAEELKITAPIELVITDESNKPVSFKSFAEKMEITLSDSVMATLKDSFNLFIYNDNNNYRLGIAIESANIGALKTAMLKEEPNLIVALIPILNNPENKELGKGIFASNTYKGTAIRYLNVVSPEYLSIDYSIFQKKLVITTTKTMAMAIIDHLTPVAIKKEEKTSSIEIEKKKTEEKTQSATTVTTE